MKQKLPATRNPFTYFKRVIISIDTLKQDHLSRTCVVTAGTRW